MAHPYRIVLTDDQRAELRTLIGAGVARARILLKADHADAGPGWTDVMLARALEVSLNTILTVRQQFVQEGLTAALERKRRNRVYAHRLDGEADAQLIAVACSTLPDGQARWSLRLYDATSPVVCLDETSRQVLGETREPLPVAPGVPARYDPGYVRGGTAHLFLVTDPLRGWRHVTVGSQRTRLDFASCVEDLVDVQYPNACRIVLVMDQLNIHSTASLYAAFRPPEARRLATKLEIHHPPSMAAG